MKRVLGWLGGEKGKGAGFSLLSFGNLLIAFITYLRFAEVARIFGTTWQTDAISIAMVIPILLQQVISTAFGAAFMPVYARVMRDKGDAAANRLISRIINWMSISGALLIGAIFFFGSSVVRIIGPGMEQNTAVLAGEMLKVFLPVIFFNSIEGVLHNFMIYGKRYGLVSFVRVFQILISYVVLLLGHDSLGIMIIPVSGVAGAIASFSISAFISLRLRLRYRMVIDPRDGDFREMIRLAIPIMVGVVTGFLGPVADKLLASFLRTSSVTAIDYAARIKNLIRIVLIQPVIVLSTVSFSRIAANRNIPRLRLEIASFVNHISYYTIPVAAGLMVLSVPLISILFQRGNFGSEQSEYVGYALTYYSPWLAQFGIGLIIRRAFYSIKETVTPVVIGIWGVLANILLNVILIERMGIGGLALATTITSTAKTAIQSYLLRKEIGGIGGSKIAPELLKYLAAAAVMTGYLVAAGNFFPVNLNAPLSDRVLNLLIKIIPAGIIYIATTALLGSTTYRSLLNRVRSRKASKRQP